MSDAMSTLTINDFTRLADEDKAAVKAWMREHGLNPDATRELRFKPGRVIAVEYLQRNGGPVLDRRRDQVRTVERGARLIRPFPEVKRNPAPLTLTAWLDAVATHGASVPEWLTAQGHAAKVIYAKAEKSARRGYTDYGVSAWRPWLTPKGERWLAEHSLNAHDE